MCLLSTPRSSKWWESSFSFQSAYFVQDQSQSFVSHQISLLYIHVARTTVGIAGTPYSCQLYLSFLCYMYIHPRLREEHSMGHSSITRGHATVHRVAVFGNRFYILLLLASSSHINFSQVLQKLERGIETVCDSHVAPTIMLLLCKFDDYTSRHTQGFQVLQAMVFALKYI